MGNIIVISILFLIALAFRDSKYKNAHGLDHWLRNAGILLAIEAISIYNGYVWEGVAVYIVLRGLLFDLIFGKIHKDNWFYLGTTSKWDINKKKVMDKLKEIYTKAKRFVWFCIFAIAYFTILHLLDFNIDSLGWSIVAGVLYLAGGAGLWWVAGKMSEEIE